MNQIVIICYRIVEFNVNYARFYVYQLFEFQKFNKKEGMCDEQEDKTICEFSFSGRRAFSRRRVCLGSDVRYGI